MLSGDYNKAYNDLHEALIGCLRQAYTTKHSIHNWSSSMYDHLNELLEICATDTVLEWLRDFTTQKSNNGKVKGKLNKNVALSAAETFAMRTFGSIGSTKDANRRIKALKGCLKGKLARIEKDWRA